MKPILHFQIPAHQIFTINNAQNMQKILETLKAKFSNDYEIIITPWQLQADNITNIVISPDCDLEKILLQLQSITASNEYTFHLNYLPRDVYHILDYDGDESIHPLDAMNEFWYPIIAMVNYTSMPEADVLRVLKWNNLNPFGISGIFDVNNSLKFVPNDVERSWHSNVIHYDDYILWMIGTINHSSLTPAEVYELIKSAEVNPFLITNVVNREDLFPFVVLDETTRIKNPDILNQYVQAAIFRKLNNVNGSEMIK